MASKKKKTQWENILDRMGRSGTQIYWDKPFAGAHKDEYGYYWKYPHGKEGSARKRGDLVRADPSLRGDIIKEVNIRHRITASNRTAKKKARAKKIKANPFYDAIHGGVTEPYGPEYGYGGPRAAAELYAAAQHRYRPELSPSDIKQLYNMQYNLAAGTATPKDYAEKPSSPVQRKPSNRQYITQEQRQFLSGRSSSRQQRYQAAQQRSMARSSGRGRRGRINKKKS